jgi:hypothetical protein
MRNPWPLLLLFLAAAAPRAAADSIRITEVVTDPQADHSENAGGNGVPYDLLPGTGTISSVDEFVELFNAGSTPLDLTGFTLAFLDTTPSSYTFGTTTGTGALLFTSGSSLEQVLPGGFVLLGNPPGALNNSLDIELRDPLGALLDLLTVTDGNATSGLDEAVARLWTGEGFLDETQQAPISPLSPGGGAPVPEPDGLVWLGLSVLAGASRATGGRARRAASRRRSGAPRAPTVPPGARRTREETRDIPATRGGSA